MHRYSHFILTNFDDILLTDIQRYVTPMIHDSGGGVGGGLVPDVIIISQQKSFLINRPWRGRGRAGGEITLQLSNLELAYQLCWPSQPVFCIREPGMDIPGEEELKI